ncbi:MAG: TrmJ/YjtD family RNA methyltransferase [Synechococcus sp. SB0678_bin_12]|nr:TrmJ/YjtD family RNA methyltransferase [Cyanobacteria bacterium MAG IRC4_bin_6]MXY19389.1 TrmJ/YjtD family RNA methyltransferase [Synechococcus sp. SB0664_bin_36]MYF35660.1 TrmJ/YjtD family RNA methyltransferase [Synechococcus sp. SB0678_bin_12]MYI88372.1 TrmJ/YjtD family RNA methyltransferase [Synechococcus sp. SB0672_bin_10]MYK07841.1 TrmJ/YjtD family RNA methyltransferase [Synechococcus sp. SB0670_bin_20]
MSAAPPLVVILVATAGPLNLGAVARLCANFAVQQLRLVAPRCDPHDPQALRMAVHAQDVLRNAPVFPHLDAALQDCGRVAACSARVAPEPLPTASPEQVMPWLLQPHPLPAALVCGREDHGLHNAELRRAGRLIRIPTAPAYSSMNLSHAMAVVLAAHRTASRAAADAAPAAAPHAACGAAQLTDLLEDAGALLLETGFLWPHTAVACMAKLEGILRRAEPSPAELALLRGMVRQLRWAARHGPKTTPQPQP